MRICGNIKGYRRYQISKAPFRVTDRGKHWMEAADTILWPRKAITYALSPDTIPTEKAAELGFCWSKGVCSYSASESQLCWTTLVVVPSVIRNREYSMKYVRDNQLMYVYICVYIELYIYIQIIPHICIVLILPDVMFCNEMVCKSYVTVCM